MITIEMSLRTRSWKSALSGGRTCRSRIVIEISTPARRADGVGTMMSTPAIASDRDRDREQQRSETSVPSHSRSRSGSRAARPTATCVEPEFAEVGGDLRDREDRRPLAEAAAAERAYDDQRDDDAEREVADPPDHLHADVERRPAGAELQRLPRGGRGLGGLPHRHQRCTMTSASGQALRSAGSNLVGAEPDGSTLMPTEPIISRCEDRRTGVGATQSRPRGRRRSPRRRLSCRRAALPRLLCIRPSAAVRAEARRNTFRRCCWCRSCAGRAPGRRRTSTVGR